MNPETDSSILQSVSESRTHIFFNPKLLLPCLLVTVTLSIFLMSVVGVLTLDDGL